MNQVSGVYLKNGGTLVVTVLTLLSTITSAMVLLHGNLIVMAEKSRTKIFIYFEFAVMKTGREVLLIGHG